MGDTGAKENLSHDEQWDDTLLIQQYDSTMEQLRRKAMQQMQNSSSGGQNSTGSPTNSNQAPAVQSGSACLGKKKIKPKKKKNTKIEWQVGQPCRCEFSEDGELYEATITHLERESGTAVVTYIGYGNSETVPLHKLLRSAGPLAQQQQEAEVLGDGAALEHESGVGEDDSSDCSSQLRARHRPPSSCGHSATTTTASRSSSRSSAFIPDGGGVLPDLPPPPPLGVSLSGLDDSEMLHTLLMSWYMTGYHTGYYRGVRAASHSHSHSHRHH